MTTGRSQTCVAHNGGLSPEAAAEGLDAKNEIPGVIVIRSERWMSQYWRSWYFVNAHKWDDGRASCQESAA